MSPTAAEIADLQPTIQAIVGRAVAHHRLWHERQDLTQIAWIAVLEAWAGWRAELGTRRAFAGCLAWRACQRYCLTARHPCHVPDQARHDPAVHRVQCLDAADERVAIPCPAGRQTGEAELGDLLDELSGDPWAIDLLCGTTRPARSHHRRRVGRAIARLQAARQELYGYIEEET